MPTAFEPAEGDGRPGGPAGGAGDDYDVTRHADLIAAGRLPFPRGLERGAEDRLARAVRARLRRDLVAVVARAIAQDLLRRP